MPEVFGKTRGLKASHVSRLEKLYRRRVRPWLIVSPQLAGTMVDLSREMGRQIGLLLSRKGIVTHVILGDATGLMLPELGRHRLGTGRFRGLRLVHTHLDDEPLSREDLTDLVRLRLDAVTALMAGKAWTKGTMVTAHLLPETPGAPPWRILEPEPVHHQDRDFARFVRELEEEFGRKADLLRGAKQGEAAVAVHVQLPAAAVDADQSLSELAELARTAGVVLLDKIVQRRPAFDPRTLVGKGKLQEIVQRATQLDAELLLVDHDLSPNQLRTMSEATDLKVIDRTTLILDIFAQHAHTRAGKLQVELAQLRYTLPRLAGRYGAIMRQTGGIGTRGPGEKKLELDRRRIQRRIRRIEEQLAAVSRHRQNTRARRRRRGVPVVALVGYTNAGKSTLLNTLTDSRVRVEDKLFATLDPTSRRLRFPREREVIFTDTVGFIRDLPEDLLKAFEATLEELGEADLLLHVVDASDPARRRHVDAVARILEDLGLDRIPRILVLNKLDRLDRDTDGLADVMEPGAVLVSALDRTTTLPLLRRIERLLWERDRLEEPLIPQTG